MILFKKAGDLRQHLDKLKKMGKTTGFVPTMGALHEGHISLIARSGAVNDRTVCSIFVNPTQFNDQKDFAQYPVSIEKDLLLLEEAGCDIVFLPAVSEIYPNGTTPTRHYDLGRLETVLEGKFRPGHFQGVCMVVHRLLEIVQPDQLLLGQKDYQQCMVITQLVNIIGMSNQTEIVIAPTLRETDGLAMSSRNRRLNEQERAKAVIISESLFNIKKALKKGPVTHLAQQAHDHLTAKGFKVDYVAIVDATSLETVANWDGHTKLVALIAAFNNEIRLIDNLIITE